LNCESIIGDEPFAVLFGDEVIRGKVPRLAQMIQTFEKYGDPVLAAIHTDDKGTEKYGIIDPAAQVEKDVYQLKGVVEKPGPKKAPSRLASIGAYVLTPDIFDAIRKTKRGHGGELVLLDAIFLLMKKRPAYARLIEGEYFDTGSKLGWLEANLRFALEREDMKDGVRKLLKSVR